MVDINEYVSQRIHFFRKMRGYTLQMLADAIDKSKSTVSKYEKNEIAIDVQVLFEIACALGVHVEQFLDYPSEAESHRPPAIHSAFSLSDVLYLYVCADNGKDITESVIRTRSGEDGTTAALYMDIPAGSSNYRDCRAYYQGKVEYHTSVINFILSNQFNEAEKVFISLYNPIDREFESPGLICGLSRKNLKPMATRCILSLHKLKPDEVLLKHLLLSRQEIQSIKKYNHFIIENQLEEE